MRLMETTRWVRMMVAVPVVAAALWGATAPVVADEPSAPSVLLSIDPIRQWAGRVVDVVREKEAERLAVEQQVLAEAAFVAWVDAMALQWPVAGTFTSEFGMRWGVLHAGVDIAAPLGTPVVAARAGVVVAAHFDGGYGNKVVIDHGGGMQSLYAHNQVNTVAVGDVVGKGDVVALLGSTGHSTGPHVHFEVLVGGVAVNPRIHIG